MNYDANRRVTYCREASRVKRCHNFPWIGEYSVGQHSFDMLTLCYQLHPAPTPQLIKAIVAHDLAERMVGDMPAPFKWAMPELAAEMHGVEDQILDRVEMYVPLTADEERWLHAIDRVELWLACQEQLRLGNQNAQTMIDALEGYFAREAENLPEEITNFIDTYIPERLQDELP